jgi:high-affinity nickel-transport protein
VYYNLVVTGLSVAAAFLIGTVEILGLLTSELHLHGGLWDFMANFDINKAGFTIAGLFLVVWAVAIAVWRFAGLETRWDNALPPPLVRPFARDYDFRAPIAAPDS